MRMKALQLFAFLLLLGIPVLTKAQVNSNIRVDTLRQGAIIWLDTSVTSFHACMILPGGIALEKCCQGNRLFDAAYMKPGSIIIIDHITSRNRAGGTVRLPTRKFVVQ